MSKRSGLLCVLLLLLQAALLSGDQQLAVAAAAQIGDEFLFQDPIRGPGSVMPIHASRDELNGASAAAPDSSSRSREEEADVFVDEEAFLSGDEYTGDEEDEVLLGDRSVAEEFVDEDSLLLGGEGTVAEGSNNDWEEHGSDGGVRCPECGKHFRSDKSMFGHLRSHPDRGYKGATPPHAKPKLLPPPADDRRPVARYSRRDTNMNSFEILAAYGMLMLKDRDAWIAQDRSIKRKLDVPQEEEDSVVSKAGDDVLLGDRHDGSVTTMARDDMVPRSEQGSSAADMAGDDHHRSERGSSSAAEMAGDDHHLSEHSSSVVVVEVPAKRGGTKKSKKGLVSASASKARRPYICKHCQAVFPTHQALGGHMAAHSKEERRVQAQNEQSAASCEAHHQGSLNRQGGGGGGGDGEQHGHSASSRALLMEHYTRLFNEGWQSRQETGGGYKRQHDEMMDGGTGTPPVADGDRHRLFGEDLSANAPEQG